MLKMAFRSNKVRGNPPDWMQSKCKDEGIFHLTSNDAEECDGSFKSSVRDVCIDCHHLRD